MLLLVWRVKVGVTMTSLTYSRGRKYTCLVQNESVQTLTPESEAIELRPMTVHLAWYDRLEAHALARLVHGKFIPLPEWVFFDDVGERSCKVQGHVARPVTQSLP